VSALAKLVPLNLDARAERLVDVRMRGGGRFALRSAILRPVYCPRCGMHRTLLVDRATWVPEPRVKHVPCAWGCS
jgi:hypothetical protein